MRHDARIAVAESVGSATPFSDVQRYYSRHSRWSDPGAHAGLFEALPADVAGLTRIVQGLCIYGDIAEAFYGFTPPPERLEEMHLRTVEAMLARIAALDARPLAEERPVDKRLVGRCHHFSLLLVAMLRARGAPARLRGGFGAYFNPPCYEDHWVCEYWNAAEERWAIADPQFDVIWRERFATAYDVLDVPRDQFLTAADAWIACREGKADPAKFGISFTGLRGLWFAAGDLVRDLAALNRAEMLPWDCWGAMPDPDAELDSGKLAFFDRIAMLTREPDRTFPALRALYEGDEGLSVPATVFNAVTNRPERIG